jgi:putative holliday junction resolvase
LTVIDVFSGCPHTGVRVGQDGTMSAESEAQTPPTAVSSRPGRVAALDLGSRRIGVASTDLTQTLASPHVVIERRGSRSADHAAIRREVVDELEAVRVIVGLPISLDGREGPAAIAIRTETEELADVLPVPVELFDERYTTTLAHASMMERKMKADARRRVVDKVAAAVLLQSWLDARPAPDAERLP